MYESYEKSFDSWFKKHYTYFRIHKLPATDTSRFDRLILFHDNQYAYVEIKSARPLRKSILTPGQREFFELCGKRYINAFLAHRPANGSGYDFYDYTFSQSTFFDRYGSWKPLF